MTSDLAVALTEKALWMAVVVGGPLLAVGLVVGLVTSLLQATTQLNDQALAFVPKIAAMFLALLFFGPWMLQTLVQFARSIFGSLATMRG